MRVNSLVVVWRLQGGFFGARSSGAIRYVVARYGLCCSMGRLQARGVCYGLFGARGLLFGWRWFAVAGHCVARALGCAWVWRCVQCVSTKSRFFKNKKGTHPGLGWGGAASCGLWIVSCGFRITSCRSMTVSCCSGNSPVGPRPFPVA